MAKKVLVVDDDPNTVRFLTIALEENGYQAIGASDGKEGMDKARSESPDLVLLDVMMPKRTGFTLFKQLRKEDNLKDIPVIMLTGVGSSLDEADKEAAEGGDDPYTGLRDRLRQTIAEMKEEGLDRPEHYFEKPIDPDEVIARIRELIGT